MIFFLNFNFFTFTTDEEEAVPEDEEIPEDEEKLPVSTVEDPEVLPDVCVVCDIFYGICAGVRSGVSTVV